MPNRRLAMLSTLLTLGLAVASASAQSTRRPADSVLAAISARGRYLQHYDIAAWHGGDAVAALQPKPDEIKSAVAVRNPDGSWYVAYGHLTARKDTFYTTIRAVQTDGDSAFTASRVSPAAATTGPLREMALALETASQQFGKVTRPYNSYVIPATDGGFWVYFLPAATSSRSFPLGGDIRYHVLHGTTITDSLRMHRTVFERQTGATSSGAEVASIHTSFDSLPAESDVFVVLRQFPRLPELVATKDFTYEVAVTGDITWVRSGQGGFISSSPAGMTTTPGHIPVWTPTYDTVGSAPRVMSPGYTAWHDTTTGWRMSFERTIAIKGADSGSFNTGGWRAQLLADGKILVTHGARGPQPIQLYDITGEFIREIGQAGSGPGAFASSPTVAVKGDTIIAFDGIQATMTLFTMHGEFVRSFRVDVRGAPIPIGIDPRGYIRVQQTYGVGFGDTLSRMQWLYYTTRGALVDSLQRPTLPAPRHWNLLDGTRAMSFAVPLSPNVADVFLPDGTLMYGTGDRFEFFVTRTGRDTVRIFGRSDLHPIPLTTGFIDTTLSSLVKQQPLMQTIAKRSDFPANYPLWNTAAVDEQGFVWVSIGLPGRTQNAVGIYSPDGRYLGMAPLWWERIDQMSFGADRMAYVTYDAARRAVVRVYKVERRQ